MSNATMPVLLYCLGGEMVYILQQRLTAQNIAPEKAVRVLEEVSKAMFATAFVEEIMRPQETYSTSSLREIFDRLAHSSIMRLSKTSMDKLYDLMTMGVKFQLVSIAHPVEVIDITLNHLDSIEAVIAGTSAYTFVRAAKDAFIARYTALSMSALALLRQDLLEHFADRRVKVSLFLQDAVQNQDGSFVVAPRGPLPLAGRMPDIFNPFASLAECRNPAIRTRLGCNMYVNRQSRPQGDSDKPAAQLASSSASSSASASSLPTSSSAGSVSGTAPANAGAGAQQRKATAVAALNLLSNMLGTRNAEDKSSFKLSLFGEPTDDDDSAASKSASSPNSGSDVIVIDRESRTEHVQRIMADFDLDSTSSKNSSSSKSKQQQADEDDLLDLLDQAS
jgi:hypothetical protein